MPLVWNPHERDTMEPKHHTSASHRATTLIAAALLGAALAIVSALTATASAAVPAMRPGVDPLAR
jgi:hypothetical protein